MLAIHSGTLFRNSVKNERFAHYNSEKGINCEIKAFKLLKYKSQSYSQCEATHLYNIKVNRALQQICSPLFIFSKSFSIFFFIGGDVI